jgi:muramoyltetrapeptide carboxypeptidase
MICPSYLKPGDTIAIAAPARKISAEEIAPAVALLEAKGFRVLVPEKLFGINNQLSGSDEERAGLIIDLLKNDDVKAILFARGGYGSIRTVAHIPEELFLEHPKWLVGYSDITVFHNLMSKLGIQSLHATMPINFPKDGVANSSVNSLVDALMGRSLKVTAQPHTYNNKGKANGILTGGNLSVIYSLAGTPIDLIPDGRILFIEDLDEYLYHIDRMMMNLKVSGKLSKIAGLVVGGMSDMRDNTIPWGHSAYDTVVEVMKDYDIPVAFGFPAGHQVPNLAMTMGATVELKVNEDGISLTSVL